MDNLSSHNSIHEDNLGCSVMRLALPEYEVFELHVTRAELVARYYLLILLCVES